MRCWIGFALTIALVLTEQHEMSAQPKLDEHPVGKIAVTAKGAVSFDGAAITLDVLKQKLADLKRHDGVVWYYREATSGEALAQAIQVVRLVVDNRLPISMSTKPDYSDVLLPDGTTRPRASQGQR
jgi:hypothetical protein